MVVANQPLLEAIATNIKLPLIGGIDINQMIL